jgi:hypothetical protein
VTQARSTQHPEPDEDWPQLPSERALPGLPSDAVPELDEEDLPEVPASDILHLPVESEVIEPDPGSLRG